MAGQPTEPAHVYSHQGIISHRNLFDNIVQHKYFEFEFFYFFLWFWSIFILNFFLKRILFVCAKFFLFQFSFLLFQMHTFLFLFLNIFWVFYVQVKMKQASGNNMTVFKTVETRFV